MIPSSNHGDSISNQGRAGGGVGGGWTAEFPEESGVIAGSEFKLLVFF